MKNLTAYELFEKRYEAEKHHQASRISKLGEGTVEDGVKFLYHWFKGSMMSDPDSHDMDAVIETFDKISKVYHKPLKGPMYRASHLHLDGTEYKAEDIKDIKQAKTGPKHLQSWAKSKVGAKYFFKHFVDEQNRHARPHPTRSWVIFKAEATHLDQFMTFEECMQFLYDADKAGYDEAMNVYDRMNDDEMLKNHELICRTPDVVPVEVVDILVPPGKPSKEDTRQDDEDDLFARLDRLLKHAA